MTRFVFFVAGCAMAVYSSALRVDVGGEHVRYSAALLALGLSSIATALIGLGNDEEEASIKIGLGLYFGDFARLCWRCFSAWRSEHTCT